MQWGLPTPEGEVTFGLLFMFPSEPDLHIERHKVRAHSGMRGKPSEGCSRPRKGYSIKKCLVTQGWQPGQPPRSDSHSFVSISPPSYKHSIFSPEHVNFTNPLWSISVGKLVQMKIPRGGASWRFAVEMVAISRHSRCQLCLMSGAQHLILTPQAKIRALKRSPFLCDVCHFFTLQPVLDLSPIFFPRWASDSAEVTLKLYVTGQLSGLPGRGRPTEGGTLSEMIREVLRMPLGLA